LEHATKIYSMATQNHKDYFSSQASVYAAFRPTYPAALYEFIFQHLKHRESAWDCATGNGQVAQYLAGHFGQVYGTDISQKQLNEAKALSNIVYALSPAEKTGFANKQFDLVTVGQALHWFDRPKFYNEVNRVTKSGGLLAVWGYALLYVDSAIDPLVMNFYNNVVGPYWDEARKLVEDQYTTIEFPFEEIPSPEFFIYADWTLAHLAGYLESWSATQKYIKVNQSNPVPQHMRALADLWSPDEVKHVRFPVFLKLGLVE
jgi:ubiquinone/menaquinone biosynthesis C-methylase UbiE